jgi:hypothetical protein
VYVGRVTKWLASKARLRAQSCLFAARTRRSRSFAVIAGALAASLLSGSAAMAAAPFAAGVSDAGGSDALIHDGGPGGVVLDAGGADAGRADAGRPDAGGADAGRAVGASPVAPVEPGPAENTEPVVAPLPTIEPDPAVAPVIEGRSRQEPTARPVAPGKRSGVVVETILGLLALLVLAYLGGHRRVLELEARLGIAQVITTGFPFVLLGMLARTPRVGILSDGLLVELSPLLQLGLGWVGFVTGFRFDARIFQGLSPVTGRIVVLSTLLPFAFVVGACGALLFGFSHEALRMELRDPVFLRDALILGTAATMTAVSSARAVANADLLSRVIRLEELSGIAGLAFVAAFFRPRSASWQVPGAAWLLLTIGLGATTGLLIYVILQRRAQAADFLVLTLGSISFAAGAAGYLRLSSVVVAFIAGALLANFPGAYHERLRDLLLRIERPIYLLSLIIIGALWRAGDWRGWLLMPVFALLRLAGKAWGTRLALRSGPREPALDEAERRALFLPPLGPLAIAIVINAQLLYPGGSISLIVSAVIGGGILTEVFVQLASRRSPGPELRGAA